MSPPPLPRTVPTPLQEFIIRTTLPNGRHVFVSRRYGDFRTLADEVRLLSPSMPLLTPTSSARPTPTRSCHRPPPRIAPPSMPPSRPPPLHRTRSVIAFIPRTAHARHPVSPEKRTASLFVPISTPCSQPRPSPRPPFSVRFS